MPISKLKKFDPLQFIFLFFLIFFVWILHGWHPDLFIGSFDYIQGHYPLQKVLYDHQYNWLSSTTTILNGAYVGPVAGYSVILDLLYRFGFDEASSLNYSVLLAQSFFSYFVFKTISLEEFDWNSIPLSVSASFFSTLVWRIEHGHLPFLWCAPLVASILLVSFSLHENRKISGFTIFLIYLTFINTLTQASHQLLIYTLFLFLVPVFSLYKRKDFKLWVLFIAATAVFSSPYFYQTFLFLKSGDASRGLYDEVAFSYYVSSAQDLVSLIFTQSKLLLNPNVFIHHETSYPIFFMLIMFFIQNKKFNIFERILFFISIFASVLVFLISMDLPVLSKAISNIPFISSFRLPIRFLFVTSIVMLILNLKHLKTFKNLWVVAFVCLLVSIALKNIYFYQVILYMGLTYILFKKKFSHEILTTILCLFIFSSASIPTQSFSISAIDETYKQLKEIVLSNTDEDDSIVVTGDLKNIIGPNIYMGLKRKSVEGYWQPVASFNKDFSEALSRPHNPTNLYFIFNNHDEIQKVSEKYPVNYIYRQLNNKIVVNKISDRKLKNNFLKSFNIESETRLLFGMISLLTLALFMYLYHKGGVNV